MKIETAEQMIDMLKKQSGKATENELIEMGFVEKSCGTDTDTPEGCNDYYMNHKLFKDEFILEMFGELVLMFVVEDRVKNQDEVTRKADAENIKGKWTMWTK